MNYDKPELLIIGLAADAVRAGTSDCSGAMQDVHYKRSTVFEGASDGANGYMTSSSSGAYEADE